MKGIRSSQNTRQSSTAGTVAGRCGQVYRGPADRFDMVEVRRRTVDFQSDGVLWVALMTRTALHICPNLLKAQGPRVAWHLGCTHHPSVDCGLYQLEQTVSSGEGRADSAEGHTHLGQKAHWKSRTFSFLHWMENYSTSASYRKDTPWITSLSPVIWMYEHTLTFFFCFFFGPPLSKGQIILSAFTHSSYLKKKV